MADEGRKNPRFELKDYGVEIEIQGARVQAKIQDISEGGAQILLRAESWLSEEAR